MGILSWLFGRSKERAGRPSSTIPIVQPATRRGEFAPPQITVFGPEVQTFMIPQVVYGEGEIVGPGEKSRIPIGQWIPGESSAITRFKWDPYNENLNFGNMVVQFVTSSKQYTYPQVPWIVLRDMYNAGSRGKFVEHTLRPLYSVGIGGQRGQKRPHPSIVRGRRLR